MIFSGHALMHSSQRSQFSINSAKDNAQGGCIAALLNLGLRPRKKARLLKLGLTMKYRIIVVDNHLQGSGLPLCIPRNLP
jgi:hypothetical protein